MAERMERISLEEYHQQQERYLQERKGFLEAKFIERAKALLREPPFSYSEKEATKTAENVVLRGAIITTNADSSDSEDDGTEEINGIHNDLKEKLKYEVAALFIQAPNSKIGRLTYEKDVQSRDLQYKNFVKLHQELKQDNAKIYKTDEKVHDYEEMKKTIQNFLEKHGSKSILASISFSGHGSSKGLCLEEEKDDIPLDTVLDDIRDIFAATRSDLGLPDTLELILGECYAHEHKEFSAENMIVHTFTSPEKPKTTTLVEFDPLTTDVVDANHLEFNNHAQQKHPAWEEARKKFPADSPEDGPATGVRGPEQGGGDVKEIEEMEDRIESLEIE